MTPVETRAFLLEGTRTGKLASVIRDGSPHVMPIWFLLTPERVIAKTGVAD